MFCSHFKTTLRDHLLMPPSHSNCLVIISKGLDKAAICIPNTTFHIAMAKRVKLSLSRLLMRTRGAKTDVDRSRVRPPTQSNRRDDVEKRRKQQQFDDEHSQQHQPEELIFPGGPYDLSVLKDYEHHIAINVWNGQYKLFYHLPAQIDHWITISGLRPLRRCSLHMIDGNMIFAFAERWHAETSSFHLPFGEMTITLDDVRDLAIAAAVELLGVAYDEAVTETRTYRGASYSFEWLKEVFFKKLHEGRYDCAAKAYLLHLVGCTILVDKSFTLVSVKYLFLFQDLDTCGKWAWRPTALVVLYHYLITWIYEHFPDICKRDMDEFISSMPQMFRWTTKQTFGHVAYYRVKLDALRDTDIIWTPNYDENSMT
uniref:Protein MAIN-LIKE 1-like n=1 Tax=Cicer arietinum TaxID=3827 RepID=A0A3Q7XX66_CICAR|nr:protein MAIN-LIKE 1-like [Cicer arietinum]